MPYRTPGGYRLDCPRCNNTEGALLQSSMAGRSPVERCPHCEGVWVSRRAFNDIRTDLEAWQEILQTECQRSEWESEVVYLSCPECGEQMRRRNFGQRSGVVVDDCNRHGVWFDRGELHRAVEFMHNRLIAPVDRATPTTATRVHRHNPRDYDLLTRVDLEETAIEALIRFLVKR